MGINYNKENKIFSLQTMNTTYQMRIAEYGYLEHLYYGKKITGDLAWEKRRLKRSFICNPHDAGRDRVFTIDTLEQEYSTFGASDYRTSALNIINSDGSEIADLRYKEHRIYKGKYKLEGLPAAYGEEFDTLEVTLSEIGTGMEVILLYGVLEKYDLITRAVKIVNTTDKDIILNKAMSMCLDFDHCNYDLLSFYGHWTGERLLERKPLRHGKTVMDSARGVSSHHYNPSAILAGHDTNEIEGNCYGFAFVYSGNFSYTAEVDSVNQTRFVMGINPDTFRYTLCSKESFETPEVLITFSSRGFSKLSNNFHHVIRDHICRGIYKKAKRPILVNNWEATKMDFTEEKLLHIAKEAKNLGVEMFVMDDGWFGKRDDDYQSLGDWVVDRRKLPGGLDSLGKKINSIGMKFGIWVEPEMVNEDSDLYRAHEDWCLKAPGRNPARGRYQLVLDMSRKEVQDYIFNSLSEVFHSAPIEYVKWDMNRSITDVWSVQLSPEKQGEVMHRYVLGLYSIMERLIAAFPNILWEACCSGGGRFDVGMLYYMPQIWCSDNTDAIARTEIQYGTSFIYPVSTVGAHVSACPNQQTGRSVPIDTRAAVAYYGTFGYELDFNEINEEEKRKVREQIQFFHKYYEIFMYGDYYRLTNADEHKEYIAWCSVNEDKTQAVMCYLQKFSRSNAPFVKIYFQGLVEDKMYQINKSERIFSGSALMYAGLTMQTIYEDNIAELFVLKAL